MQKISTLLLFLFSLSLGFTMNLSIKGQTNSTDEEGVQDVIFDRTEAIIRCPPQSYPNRACEDSLNVRISTVAKDVVKNGLEFYYLVSGGKIIGKGAKVIWDFTNTRPGKYLIAVGVGKDGVIQGITFYQNY
jgi:hypothetical protein